MKSLITLTIALLSIQLTAQSGFERILELSQSLNRGINEFDPSPRSSAFTHKLDSILTLDFNDDVVYKVEMEYNAEGQTTLVRQYEKDSLTGEIILISVITLEYDNSSLPTFMAIDALDEETQQLTRIVEYELFYDGSDRLDSLVLSTEDPISGEFGQTLAFKNVFVGDLLELSRQWYNLGFWIPFSETDYIYDQNDRLVEEIHLFLNFSTFQLENLSRSVYTYDGNGNRESVTTYLWQDPDWIADSRTLFEYHANGTIESDITQVYIGDTWVNEYWNVYHQDEIDDVYDVTSYAWINDVWVETDSIHYVMNPSLPWENVAAPRELTVIQQFGLFATYFLSVSESSFVETELYSYSSFAGWLYRGRDLYFYSLFDPSGIETVLPSGLMISPNPTSADMIVQLENDVRGKYVVTSTTGQLISAGNLVQGSNIVNTTSLPSGMYMVLIELQDGTKYIHKQIIE